MTFDYKKEYQEFYRPKKTSIIEIPAMNYLAVRGTGDPNAENGAYQKALNALYSVAYTLKMSYKGTYQIDGFFQYVVPPLEGFWWQEDVQGIDYAHKETFNWISLIRLPDFIQPKDVAWGIKTASAKKKQDFSNVEFFSYQEGLCVQALHVGSYDDEPATIAAMTEFAKEQGYQIDINNERYHHEIYLNDPRKTATEKLKTVIRHPVKKVSSNLKTKGEKM